MSVNDDDDMVVTVYRNEKDIPKPEKYPPVMVESLRKHIDLIKDPEKRSTALGVFEVKDYDLLMELLEMYGIL
jgi:hypothetical protein